MAAGLPNGPTTPPPLNEYFYNPRCMFLFGVGCGIRWVSSRGRLKYGN